MQRFPMLEDAGIRTLFCGPESFTDDISPMLGESPEVDGLYLACGLNSVGILHGRWARPRDGAVVDRGVSADRPHRGRGRPYARVPGHAGASARSAPSSGSGSCSTTCRGPTPQPKLGRNVRRSRSTTSTLRTARTSLPTNGWEYPEFFSGPGTTPTVEWGFKRGIAFDRTRDEHLNARENVGGIDMTMMSNYLVQGPHAMQVMNRVCANDIDTEIGRVVYTQWLDERGGIIADVTVTRQADDQFMVISADNVHRRLPAWIRRNTSEGEFLTCH